MSYFGLMLAACIIVVACTLFLLFQSSLVLSTGKAARLHFSQSVLAPLETEKDAREVKKSAQCVRTERVHLFVLF